MDGYTLLEYRPGRWAKVDARTGDIVGPASPQEITKWRRATEALPAEHLLFDRQVRQRETQPDAPESRPKLAPEKPQPDVSESKPKPPPDRPQPEVPKSKPEPPPEKFQPDVPESKPEPPPEKPQPDAPKSKPEPPPEKPQPDVPESKPEPPPEKPQPDVPESKPEPPPEKPQPEAPESKPEPRPDRPQPEVPKSRPEAPPEKSQPEVPESKPEPPPEKPQPDVPESKPEPLPEKPQPEVPEGKPEPPPEKPQPEAPESKPEPPPEPKLQGIGTGVAKGMSLFWPLIQKYRTTSSFQDHKDRNPPSTAPGLDFGCPLGTEARAWAAGKVIRSRWSAGGGRSLWIQHGRGLKTYYAHLNCVCVLEGETVSAGQKIGETGSTGHSTGPHLHFSVVRQGQYVDPEQLLVFEEAGQA